ncbi:MAG: chemotaxis response regulator protein-glutamate methylesterase [Lachnospiraceae bacterium]|nr:chemotaxis response regulator protein-glutamate methylesterase [Lachnospiraceae bacterium]MBR4992985.1 chemotaxis response regulator protein-glutamate methylesterase [Lachnospiraceae bacterium]
MKKVLVVDDSALMRRVLCDIINSDTRFRVVNIAGNGLEALNLLTKGGQYDAVVLDVNMPQMNGIELLKELRKKNIRPKIMMASTDTMEGAQVTIECLELGAIDFVHKPSSAMDCRDEEFKKHFLDTLFAVSESNTAAAAAAAEPAKSVFEDEAFKKLASLASRHKQVTAGSKIVAIASSTGGPKALQSVIPKLPANLNAPIVMVQHMPVGFTASLAERLTSLGELKVKEAAEGDKLQKGHAYLSKGGAHMNIVKTGADYTIHYTDEPNREGVKPCANYMYESLANSGFDEICCVVMTGMGADGTEGIKNLKNSGKKLHVITQSEDTCVVYGMPKAAVNAGLSNQVAALDQIAQEIILNVGVS